MTVAERDHSGIDAAAQDPDRSDVEVLFKRLAACGTHSERRRWRQRIITECLPLADHIAYRYVGGRGGAVRRSDPGRPNRVGQERRPI